MYLSIAITCILLVMAAIWDIRFRLIPNVLSIAVFALALFHIFLEVQWAEATGYLLVGTAAFFCGMVIYAFDWFGGGDVKLIAALAFWAGPEHILTLFIVTTLAGGVLGLIYLASAFFHKSPAVLIGANWFFESMFKKPAPEFFVGGIKNIELPYGVAIAVGGVAILYDIAGLG